MKLSRKVILGGDDFYLNLVYKHKFIIPGLVIRLQGRHLTNLPVSIAIVDQKNSDRASKLPNIFQYLIPKLYLYRKEGKKFDNFILKYQQLVKKKELTLITISIHQLKDEWKSVVVDLNMKNGAYSYQFNAVQWELDKKENIIIV